MLYLGNDYKYIVKAGTIVKVGFINGNKLDVISVPLEKTFFGKTCLLNSELPALNERCLVDTENVFIYCKKEDMLFLINKGTNE